MKLLIAGATGHVGMCVLELAERDPRITHIVAPVRKPLTVTPKLTAPIVDFDNLPEQAEWWQVDAIICALGTTMHNAGSQDAFRRVDYEYPMAIARLARRRGVATFVLTSALGADPDSYLFYYRIKGELERDLSGLEFQSLTFVRPGVLGGSRDEFRLGERLSHSALKVLEPVLPTRWRVSSVDQVAQSLLDAAVDAPPGVHTVTSERLT